MKTIPDLINALEETRLSDCDKSVLKKLLATMKEPEPPIELKPGQVWRKAGAELAVFEGYNNNLWYGIWTTGDVCPTSHGKISNLDFNGISKDDLIRGLTGYTLVGTAELVVKYL